MILRLLVAVGIAFLVWLLGWICASLSAMVWGGLLYGIVYVLHWVRRRREPPSHTDLVFAKACAAWSIFWRIMSVVWSVVALVVQIVAIYQGRYFF